MYYPPSKEDLDAVSIDISDFNLHDIYLLDRKYQIWIAVGFALILSLFLYWLVVSDLPSTISDQQAKEQEARAKYVSNANKVAQMPHLKKEIQEIKESYNNILHLLPNSFSAADFVEQFYRAGAKNGLRISVNKNLQLLEAGPLLVRSYTIEVNGTYSQLEKFCMDLAKLDNLVVLSNLHLSNEHVDANAADLDNHKKKSADVLHLSVVANTYQTRQ